MSRSFFLARAWTSVVQRIGHALSYVVRGTGIPASWFNRSGDYEGSARPFTQPYANSVWVAAAVKKVAGPISAVEICCLDEQDEELNDARLEAFWRAPALNGDGSRMSQADFLELCSSWLCLQGEIFFVLDDTWRLPFPDVDRFGGYTPLIIARPDRMKHLLNGTTLVGWELSDAMGSRRVIPAEQVIQIKTFNPYDDYRGLGAMQAAEVAAGGDYAAGLFAKNTAEANGDQGVYVVAKNGLLDDIQREQIVSSLRDKRSAQSRGIFRPAFLTGDITIEDPKVRSVDVAFVSQRQAARQEIAIAFGVPPSFFDPVASYSIGAASDRYILIEETCKPMGCKICGGLSRVSERLRGLPTRCELDWDDHSTMQQVRQSRIATGLQLWGTGMPMDDVSDYLNLDLPQYAGSDVGFMPFSVSAYDPLAIDPAADAAFSENTQSPAQTVEDAFRCRALARSHPCTCQVDWSDLTEKAGDSKDVRLWKKLIAPRRTIMAAYESKFNRVLMGARREVLGKLIGSAAKGVTKALASDFMFNLTDFTTVFNANMRGVAGMALQAAGEQVMAELRLDNPWTMPSPAATQFFHDRENKMSNIPVDVFKQIEQVLNDGLMSGQPLTETAKDIRAAFNDISKGRSKVIATTETAAAYGKGRDEAMRSVGVTHKRWLNSGNSNVRPAHLLMQGTVIPMNESFTVTNPDTGETDVIDYPADGDGEPWDVINCHCIAIAVKVEPEEEET